MTLREPWRTRLLFLSVALNLFAAALIGAFVLHRPSHRPPGWAAMVERMAHDLSPEDKARFLPIMEQARPETELARRRMEEARRAVSRAMAQTPYDEDAVRQAMAAWQAAWMQWSDGLGATMRKALAELSPEGRRHLADAGRRRRSPP